MLKVISGKYNNKIHYIKKFLTTFILITPLFYYQVFASDNNIDNQIVNKKKDKNYNISNNSTDYLLGPGDQIYINLKFLPEYNGFFNIDPDGTISLTGINEKIYLQGYTKNEAYKFLLEKYKEFIFEPELSIFITIYRPITVYVRGEVSKPGLYTIMGSQRARFSLQDQQNYLDNKDGFNSNNGVLNEILLAEKVPIFRGFSESTFPTIYDALRVSKGITPYSDLSSITVVRKNSISNGGGKIKTKLNFLKLFKNGDLSQNIRVFDQDVITVGKSKEVLTDQLIEANNSNLLPNNFEVLVTGNIFSPGIKTMPKGSTLNQAIQLSGKQKLLSGNIEFLRYDINGKLDKRTFRYNNSAKINTYKNPILREGDIIHVYRSPVGQTSDLIKEIVSPVVNSYTLYKIFTD